MNKLLFIKLIGVNMLKKVVVLMFLGIISMTSMSALAANDTTENYSNKSLTIVNSTQSESVKMQVEKLDVNESQSTASQGPSKGNATLPLTGWFLALALFGFVILSNRSAV